MEYRIGVVPFDFIEFISLMVMKGFQSFPLIVQIFNDFVCRIHRIKIFIRAEVTFQFIRLRFDGHNKRGRKIMNSTILWAPINQKYKAIWGLKANFGSITFGRPSNKWYSVQLIFVYTVQAVSESLLFLAINEFEQRINITLSRLDNDSAIQWFLLHIFIVYRTEHTVYLIYPRL